MFRKWITVTALMMCFSFSQFSLAGLPDSSKLQALKNKLQKRIEGFQKVMISTNKCLTVTSNNMQQIGAGVNIWDCDQTSVKQKWKYENENLINSGNLCLQNTGAAINNQKCNGSVDQKWRIEGAMIKNSKAQCLQVVAAEINKNGGLVQIANCTNQPHQHWRFSK